MLMNHMSLYLAEPSDLTEKLAEYEAVIADTRKALEMLQSES